jgi:hypothetical protein
VVLPPSMQSLRAASMVTINLRFEWECGVRFWSSAAGCRSGDTIESGSMAAMLRRNELSAQAIGALRR